MITLKLFSPAILFGFCGSYAKNDLVWLLRYMLSSTKKLTRWCLCVASLARRHHSSALVANSSNSSLDLPKSQLYSSLPALINGMCAGSMQNVAKLYPNITQLLANSKVVNNEILPELESSNKITLLSDAELSMLILAGSRKQPGHFTKYRNVERKLFKMAFESLCTTQWKDLESCKLVSELCDFLMDQMIVASRESFVDAGVEYFLERSMFPEAFCFWRIQVRVYHTIYGMQSLLNYVISRYSEHEGVCKDRVAEIMRESIAVIKPTEFIASVVTAIVISRHLEDAKLFMKLFSIPALHFSYSLRKVADQEDIDLIEKFGELLSDVYFKEFYTPLKRSNKTSTASDPTKEPATISSQCTFNFLLSIWKLPSGAKKLKKFMKKQSKPRLHKVDIRQLEDFSHSFILTWIKAADSRNDCESLIRLHKFMTINMIYVRPYVERRCRKIFQRTGRIDDCPFAEPVADRNKSRRRLNTQLFSPAILFGFCGSYAENDLVWLLRYMLSSTKKLTRWCLCVASLARRHHSSALVANSSNSSLDLPKSQLYSSLPALINGMCAGSMQNVAKLYPNITQLLANSKVVNNEILPELESSNKITLLSDAELSMLILAGSKRFGSPLTTRRKQYLARILSQLCRYDLIVGIKSINALLLTSLDNDVRIDSAEFLRMLFDNGVDPDFETFELLSRFYAMNANPKAIVDLMTVISEEGNELSISLFESLAYAETAVSIGKSSDSTNDSVDALTPMCRVVELYIKKCGPLVGRSTFTRPTIICFGAALAFAKYGRIDDCVKVLNYIWNTYYNAYYKGQTELISVFWNRNIMEIYLHLLGTHDCKKVFTQMRPFLKLKRGKTSGIVFDVRFNFPVLAHFESFCKSEKHDAIFHLNKLFDEQLPFYKSAAKRPIS